MQLDSAVLYSNDIGNAVKFYRDIIGLEVDYIEEGKFACFLFEDGVRLSIKKAVEKREIPGAQTIFIKADNVEKLFKDLKKKGVKIRKALEKKSWGDQFSIFDPDRNKIEFLRRKGSRRSKRTKRMK